MNAKLKRLPLEYSTIGVFTFGDFKCFTLELPWRDNKQNVSCIPAGFYECIKHVSPTHGDCISIKNVIGRTHILIHAGNYTRHTKGCVLVGDSIKDLNGDNVPDVTNSKKTLTGLLSALPKSFLLEIS